PALLSAAGRASLNPLVPEPREPSSVATVPEASHRTTRCPLYVVPIKRWAVPIVMPASLIDSPVMARATPEASSLRTASGVGEVVEASHRTARVPLFRLFSQSSHDPTA